MAIESINPANGRLIRSYTEVGAMEAEAALEAAASAFATWRRKPFPERAVLLNGVAKTLHASRERFAGLMAEEMGKPLAQGRAEVDKCALCCDFYASHGARFLEHEIIPTEATRSFVSFQPLGTVLAVMPWNFPFWQVFRAAAPALMAGNTVVLKHASNVPACALAIEDAFREAGCPSGIFHTLLASSRQVESLLAHPAIVAVTLTGSTPAGQAVAAAAGRLLKKTVLELGGSDPYVILEDADLDQAAAACASARMINGGQSCIAAKRFIVQRSVLEPFTSRFIDRLQAYIMGDPADPATTLGPMARVDLRDELHDQVTRSLAGGARLLCGGFVPPGPGAFYPATALTDLQPNAPVCVEETFGPVAAILGVDSEDEAIRLANETVFGLGAAVFTTDLARGERVASQLEAGSCFVNDFVRSDPRLPFGGIRQSGYGRELSRFGIREFVNIKTTYIR